jgi:hypothetical protein
MEMASRAEASDAHVMYEYSMLHKRILRAQSESGIWGA